jgi:hypothetical protein
VCFQPLLSSHEARIDSTLEETKARIADGVTRQVGGACGPGGVLSLLFNGCLVPGMDL